jgi:hypothetical protein
MLPTPMPDTRTRGGRTPATRNPDTTPAYTGMSGSAAAQRPFSDAIATLLRLRLEGQVDRPLTGDTMPATGGALMADALPTAVAPPAAPPEVPTGVAATVNFTGEGEEVSSSDPTIVA